jgi:hypothetical protein
MRLDITKELVQFSPDRIDSSNPSYGTDNLQITHLSGRILMLPRQPTQRDPYSVRYISRLRTIACT